VRPCLLRKDLGLEILPVLRNRQSLLVGMCACIFAPVTSMIDFCPQMHCVELPELWACKLCSIQVLSNQCLERCCKGGHSGELLQNVQPQAACVSLLGAHFVGRLFQSVRGLLQHWSCIQSRGQH